MRYLTSLLRQWGWLAPLPMRLELADQPARALTLEERARLSGAC